MTDEAPSKRRRPLATAVGAWTRNRRSDDSLRRDRHKLGALVTVIGWLLHSQSAARQELQAERKAEREERATREATLTGSLINLERSIQDLKGACR